MDLISTNDIEGKKKKKKKKKSKQNCCQIKLQKIKTIL